MWNRLFLNGVKNGATKRTHLQRLRQLHVPELKIGIDLGIELGLELGIELGLEIACEDTVMTGMGFCPSPLSCPAFLQAFVLPSHFTASLLTDVQRFDTIEVDL